MSSCSVHHIVSVISLRFGGLATVCANSYRRILQGTRDGSGTALWIPADAGMAMEGGVRFHSDDC